MLIHHLALRVADCERSAQFYAGLLGLRERERRMGVDGVRAIWLAAGDCVLMLERALRGAPDSQGSGHLLAFAVDNLADWERRLAAAGMAIDDRTESTLYVRDPDGHRVGLSSHAFAPLR